MTLPATVADLKPDPKNPRRISPDAAAGLGVSLRTFGDISGLTFNRASGHLVAGHQRTSQLPPDAPIVDFVEASDDCGTVGHAAVLLPGGRRFALRVVDWDDATERAANMAANNPSIAGEFTADLDALLKETKAADPALYDALRFDGLEIIAAKEVARAGAGDMPGDPGCGEPPQEPVTQYGEMFALGPHRLLCGDSTNAEDVARLMAGEKAVLMATDPPYGVAYTDEARVTADQNSARPSREQKWTDGIMEDDRTGADIQPFLEACFSAAIDHALTDNAAWYLWHAQLTQAFFAAAAAAAAADLLIHRQIIWVKHSLLFGHGDYHWRHELCFYGWRRGHRPPFYGERNQTSVWELTHETPNDSRIHPTQKPLAIFEIPIRNHVRRGEVVYEPFAGSGTQFIAAAKVGVRCMGMEKDPRFCDVIRKRWTTWARTAGQDPGTGALE